MWLLVNCSSERFGETMSLRITVTEKRFGLTVDFTVDILIVFVILNIIDKQELTVIPPLFYS